MAKRPIVLILLQIATALASVILAVVGWRLYNIQDLTPEQKLGVNESILRMIATILVFMGSFFTIWFRHHLGKIFAILSLCGLGYFTVGIVTDFGNEKKRDLLSLGFDDLTLGNVGALLFFLGWIYLVLFSKSCKKFFEKAG
jgi:hypothetical protein